MLVPWQRTTPAPLVHCSAQIAADPDYDLPASLGSQPALRGSERPKPPSAEQLRAELEGQKETLMWRYGLVSYCAVGIYSLLVASI